MTDSRQAAGALSFKVDVGLSEFVRKEMLTQ